MTSTATPASTRPMAAAAGGGQGLGRRVLPAWMIWGISSPIYSAVFGGFTGQQSRGPRPSRGSDAHASVSISFEEAAKGITKEVEVVRIESCEKCGGTGAKAGTTAEKCTACGGNRSDPRTAAYGLRCHEHV